MKRLLTKTICLQAILFMGVAFSTSCTQKSEEKVVINTTKDALKYMNTRKNYTITYSGSRLYKHSYIYTDKVIARTSPDNELLNHYYYSDNGGTFEIEYSKYLEKYVSTEYRSTENVWNSNLTFSFLGAGTSFIDGLKDSDTEVRVKNNEIKRTFIQLLGYSAADFMSIDSLTAKYKEGVLTYTCLIGSKDYVYEVSNFGTSKVSELDNLNESLLHAYTPITLLSNARELMHANNYIQGIYYLDGDGNDGYVGNYLFNPHYFGQTYTSSADMNGYISLNCPAEEGDNAHPALKGCYYYYISNYATSPSPTLNSNAISTNPNIVDVMNYPSHLLLWNNFQRFVKWKDYGDVEILGKAYYTEDEELLADFSTNFNMDSSFEGQTPYALGVDYNIANSNDDTITFYYYFKYGSRTQCYPIPFYKFGQANVKVLDQIYNTYHTIDD